MYKLYCESLLNVAKCPSWWRLGIVAHFGTSFEGAAISLDVPWVSDYSILRSSIYPISISRILLHFVIIVYTTSFVCFFFIFFNFNFIFLTFCFLFRNLFLTTSVPLLSLSMRCSRTQSQDVRFPIPPPPPRKFFIRQSKSNNLFLL